MSIRLRFTFLYNVILAITLAIFGFSLYSIQATSTLEALKKEIIRSSDTLGKSVLHTVTDKNPVQNTTDAGNPPVNSDESIAPSIPESAGGVVPPPASQNLENSPPPSRPGNPQTQSDYPPPKPFTSFTSDQAFQYLPEREIVRVLDPDGNLIASPYGRKEDALPFNPSTQAELSSGIEFWEEGTVRSQMMLIYNRPIINNGEVQYILQVARPLSERNHSLDLLRNTLILASLCTLVAAFGIGWLFSGITLQPIKRITRTAHTIGEERDFSKRVEYSGPRDEVGLLAETFNSMLSHLQDAYQQVAHSLSQQRDFMADVSHELRTPLTTLRGNLGLLGRIPALPEDEQKDIVNDMVLESDRMIRLVNELLSLAHADTGRKISKERILIAPLIEDCCRQIQNLDEEHKISWKCPKRSAILGDRDAFRQILLILLDNSMKYSSGIIRIEVEQSTEKIRIIVADSGQGIPEEKIPHVFDRFYRVDEESSSKGFGLGLPIARSLVESMQGCIEIQSEPGKGCKVTIDFPAVTGS